MIVMAKLFELVLEKHKIHKNWMKYEIGYNVHAVMHVQQLQLVIFEKMMNCCDYLMALILHAIKMVQSIHWILVQIGWLLNPKMKKNKGDIAENIERKKVDDRVVLYLDCLFEFKFCELQFADFILFYFIQIF